MSNIKPTKEALFLNKAFKEEGIETELEHYDNHKHIDIYIPKGKLYIEIDGIQHYTSAKQIISDFQRDHYSDNEGFKTLRIPASIIFDEADSIVKAIKKIIEKY